MKILGVIGMSSAGKNVGPDLLGKLADKSINKKELYGLVEQDFTLLPIVVSGVSSPIASIRYGCASVLMDLSAKHPEKLYPHMDFFFALLYSKFRILTWNALVAIANLCAVDADKKFDAAFDKYYGLLDNEYMVTVANVVGNSGKIALAKPYLAPKVTDELLRVENISATPHLTEECKRVIAEKAVGAFDLYFETLSAEDKRRVVSFVQRQVGSSRATLKAAAEAFIQKWSQ